MARSRAQIREKSLCRSLLRRTFGDTMSNPLVVNTTGFAFSLSQHRLGPPTNLVKATGFESGDRGGVE